MTFVKGGKQPEGANKFSKGNQINKGRVPWNKGLKGIFTPWNKGKKVGNFGNGFKKGNHPKTEFKKGHTVLKGKDSPIWKGGKDRRKLIMVSKEYVLWRRSVFERDDYTCIWCGEKGGRLNADHIKPFSTYPELRFAIDNGRTLCESCHRTTDTYGGSSKNKHGVI